MRFALKVVRKNDGDFMDVIVLLSVQVTYSISCLIWLSYDYKGGLVILKVLPLRTSQFKPLTFSALDFVLSSAAKTLILIISTASDCCLHTSVIK